MPIQQTEEQRQRALADAGVSASSLPVQPAATTAASLPSASAPIDASTLGGVQPFKLPDTPSLPSYDLSTLPSIDTLSNPSPTATEKTQDALGEKALAATAKLGTKAAAQIEAENAAGLPGFNKQLNDINAQIRDLQTQSVSAYNASEGRLAPTFAIRGEQAQIERQRSVKALGLSAVAQAIQGNIALAQSQANRAVEVEFGPVQAELDYLTKALQLNEGKLTREESKRKDALTIQLAERQRLLDNAKEDKKIIYGWAAEASKNGASSLLINQAIDATDPLQALRILTPFMSDPVAKERALADLALVRAQTAKVKAETDAPGGNDTVSLSAVNWAQNIIAGRAKISDVPAAQKNGVLAYLSSTGQKLPRELNATQQTAANNANDALLSLNTIKDSLIKEDGTVDMLKLRAATAVPFGIGQRGLYTAINNVVDVISRIRTGAALTNNEVSFYKNQAPNWKDDAATVKKKIDQFAAFYSGISGTPVTVQAPDGSQFVYDDLLDPQQRLEVRQAIQAGYTVTQF